MDMSSSQPPDPRFATTRWSLVIDAGARTSPAAKQALADLCEQYWYPLYAFTRRRGASVEDAQDVTQAFFANLVLFGFY